MRGILLGGALLLLSCARAESGVDSSMALDGGDVTDGAGPPACFSGTPASEDQLLNRCSDAETVVRATLVPRELWDGTGPLPPL